MFIRVPRCSSVVRIELWLRLKAAPGSSAHQFLQQPVPELVARAWVANYRSLWEARLDHFAEAVEKKRSARRVKQKENKR
jgi:hypothetical protein